MARTAFLLTALACAALLAAPAAAQMFREKAPLSEAERAIVLDWLEGFDSDEIALIVGNLEGTVDVTTVRPAEGSHSPELASQLISGGVTKREKDRAKIVTELNRELHRSCRKGERRYLARCVLIDSTRHPRTYAEEYRLKYYGE